MFIYRLLICCTLFLINSENLFSQSFSIKGQLWLSSLTGDNIPSDISSVESNIGYIPTVSLFKNLENNKFLDLEFSYQLNRIYSGDSLMTDDNDFYTHMEKEQELLNMSMKESLRQKEERTEKGKL